MSRHPEGCNQHPAEKSHPRDDIFQILATLRLYNFVVKEVGIVCVVLSSS